MNKTPSFAWWLLLPLVWAVLVISCPTQAQPLCTDFEVSVIHLDSDTVLLHAVDPEHPIIGWVIHGPGQEQPRPSSGSLVSFTTSSAGHYNAVAYTDIPWHQCGMAWFRIGGAR